MKRTFLMLCIALGFLGCAKPKPYPAHVKQAMIEGCMKEGMSELGCTCIELGFEQNIPLKRVQKGKLKDKDYETLSNVALACSLVEKSQNFQKEKVVGLGDPQILIQNDSDYNLTVDITGPQAGSVVVAPRSTKAVKVPSGSYQVNAYFDNANVKPYQGSESFEYDYRYTWRFYIQNGSQAPQSPRNRGTT